MDVIYDVCVVGAGLWGSSAAYHLTTLIPECKVCLIGPKEPTKEDYPSTEIFGAHYDEGRISRMNVGTLTEAVIVNRSTEKYHEIQQRTGIEFFTETSNINFGPAGGQYIQDSKKVSETLGLQHEHLSNQQLKDRYPYVDIQESNQCVLQLSKSGVINPRGYLKAMVTLAHLGGCDIRDAVVDDITEISSTDGRSRTQVLTIDNGEVIRARQVLLCTGVFTSFTNLLPNHLLPDVIMSPEQTLRMEVGEEDLMMLKDMPTITSMTNANFATDCYILPPIKYPDGKYYVKIGHDDLDFLLNSKEGAIAWYRGNGRVELKNHLMQMMKKIMPDIEPVSTITDTCISTLTRSGLPYCDMVTPNLGIMIGGNAVGARMSYEMGKIGARMIVKGHWDYDLGPELFEVRYENRAKL